MVRVRYGITVRLNFEKVWTELLHTVFPGKERCGKEIWYYFFEPYRIFPYAYYTVMHYKL